MARAWATTMRGPGKDITVENLAKGEDGVQKFYPASIQVKEEGAETMASSENQSTARVLNWIKID